MLYQTMFDCLNAECSSVIERFHNYLKQCPYFQGPFGPVGQKGEVSYISCYILQCFVLLHLRNQLFITKLLTSINTKHRSDVVCGCN